MVYIITIRLVSFVRSESRFIRSVSSIWGYFAITSVQARHCVAYDRFSVFPMSSISIDFVTLLCHGCYCEY